MKKVNEIPPVEIVKYVARKKFKNYAKFIDDKIVLSQFHKTYYEILDRFAHGKIKKLIVTVPPQTGKELSDSTLVPTPTGFKRHGDLKVGDYVLGRFGQPVRVLWVSPKCQSQYVVTFSDGIKVGCHGKHEWVVYNTKKHGRPLERLETEYMYEIGTCRGERNKRGSRFNFQVDGGVVSQFESQKVPIDPYTLGAWLGDGDMNSGLIHIGCNDVCIINNTPYAFHENKGSTTRRFYSSELFSILKKEGFIRNKHIPECYLFNSVDVRKQIIAGLIDTDGTVYKKNGRVTIANANKNIIDMANKILYSLGQKTAIYEEEPKLSTSGIQGKLKVYQLCFNPTINFPCKVERKKIVRLVKNRRRAITDIEKVDNLGWGNCIQVEGGVYLVGETFVPTHNSEGSSRKLPSFLLGLNPSLKILIGSYAASLAEGFNKDVQRIMDTPEYKSLFPDTRIMGEEKKTRYQAFARNSKMTETIGKGGYIISVGRNGSLTGKSVDIAILDDLYKDHMEANSPIIREAAWKWYTTVVTTRLHNNSQQLIVFTRWHKDDLIGRIEDKENVINVEKWADLDNIPEGAWVKINFPALKVGEQTEIDPRLPGEALWEEKHSAKKLNAQRELDRNEFECLNQGNPGSAEGTLYGNFKTYTDKNDFGVLIGRGNYTDCADTGSDYLCSICYDKYQSKEAVWNEKERRYKHLIFCLVTDIIYTTEPIEVTQVSVPDMLNRNDTDYANIESNNGGRSFAVNISPKTKTEINWFCQKLNKEARILSNAANVTQSIVMPYGWESRFPKFYEHITNYLREFSANKHDDAADVLTGIVEKEVIPTIYQKRRGIRVIN